MNVAKRCPIITISGDAKILFLCYKNPEVQLEISGT